MTGRSVTAEQYGRFLIDVFEEWVRRDVGEVYVQMFDVALANWYGEPPALCIHSETCGLALALEHTGDLYSCDHFVEPDYKLGNIGEHHMGTWSPPRSSGSSGSTSATAAAVLPRVRRALRLSRRLPQGPLHRDARRRAGLNYLCDGYKAFFHHIDRPMRIMCRAARAGAARPRRSSALYAAEDARRGRNEPCT